MRRVLALLVLAALGLAGCTSADRPSERAAPTSSSPSPLQSHTPPDGTPTDEPTNEQSQESRGHRLTQVGHEDFGGRGFNGDVWAEGDYAYVGTYGGKTEDTACPRDGVKVVDISNPRSPHLVARLRNPRGTTAEDVVVRRVRTPRWSGTLAAVGIQACNIDEGTQPQTFRGLQFFDVSDPRDPSELSRWRLSAATHGCHEVDVGVAHGRVLAGCASPFAAFHGLDEAYVLDASDPRSPKLAFGWSLPGGSGGVGCLAATVAHNVRFDTTLQRAFVSYWDGGTAILDIARLEHPELVGVVEPTPRDPDGDNHSVAQIGRDKLIVLHEDFSPALPEARFGGCSDTYGAWGRLRIYDIGDPARPKLLSEFATRDSKIETMTTPEIFTVHNAEVVRNDGIVSWYSDGVRWLDLTDLRHPREVDAWVPPAADDPHGFIPSVPVVWGVYPLPERDLVLASDINSGLWVLSAPGFGDR